jgi:hypothetical protein
MAAALVKIVALVAAMAAVVALSFFLRYRCRHLPSPFLPGGERLVIVVINEQQVGEELDLTDGNVQLLCHGYSEHNLSNSVWSTRAEIPSAAAAHMTLPAVRGDEVFEVLCSYRGSNRCWAHGVRLFWNPGHDVLLCRELGGGCEVRFRKDGGVEKQYGTAGYKAQYDAQPPLFLGFVPDFDNARDGVCSSSSCIGRTVNRVIGEESCCDDSCGGWEKAAPKKSS